MGFEEAIATLDEFLLETEEEIKGGAAAATEEGKPQEEQKPGNLQIKNSPIEVKDGPKLSIGKPGPVSLLVILILFIVFAISPAYPGANLSRLQLLVNVILRGGTIKPKEESGSLNDHLQMPGSGTGGSNYSGGFPDLPYLSSGGGYYG